MDLGIRGRTALCAGASAGMGKSAALHLAREGVDLFISARGADRLKAAADEIAAQTGARVTPVVADHSTQVGRETLLRACPSPDILVITCSPPAATNDYRQITTAEWNASLETALIGPIELMRATVDGMAARGFGRVVNIGTVSAKLPNVPRLLSGPARSALHNYAVAVSKAVAAQGVAINTLLPGMFATETLLDRMAAEAEAKGGTAQDALARFVARFRIPAARFGDPDEAGAVVAMLCSRWAGYIVGQSVVMDGGLVNSLF